MVAYTFKGLTLENIVASRNLRSPQVRNYYVFFCEVPPFGILHTSEIRLLNFTLNGTNEPHPLLYVYFLLDSFDSSF